MNICLIGPKGIAGGCIRLNEVNKFLVKQGFNVEIFYTSNILRLNKNKQNRQSTFKVNHDFLKYLKKTKFDAVISIENGHIFLDHLDALKDTLKVFFCEAPFSDEYYYVYASNHSYAKGFNIQSLNDIRRLKEEEINIFENCDHVIFPWETYEEYTRKYVYSDKKLKTIRFGCTPADKKVSYFYPTSMIYLGSLERYYTNSKLLAYLTKINPNIIDIYGSPKPNPKYNLRYKGVAKSLDVFYDYQFGLNTVSKDKLRQLAFSCKILSYLSYGLPTFFPEWQKFPKEMKGCISYNEDNFIEKFERFSEKEMWEKKSNEAYEQAKNLDWNLTLHPLLKILNK